MKKACALLHEYQDWRRGGDGEMPNPREIGRALDLVLDFVENQMSGQSNERQTEYQQIKNETDLVCK